MTEAPAGVVGGGPLVLTVEQACARTEVVSYSTPWLVRLSHAWVVARRLLEMRAEHSSRGPPTASRAEWAPDKEQGARAVRHLNIFNEIPRKHSGLTQLKGDLS
ncbi:hypothetical protein SKAU_G00352110 [Synaphobranchus kaupii]|uniref:Uncharacterized protein n=1 Tax=Synaphobranchus kaupii TaxID=118154 RepID=A0A9Q1EKT7_SYNKA|nr:hypothetical protein SKAU_G00352110 [Synaphobranchus kaupii]